MKKDDVSHILGVPGSRWQLKYGTQVFKKMTIQRDDHLYCFLKYIFLKSSAKQTFVFDVLLLFELKF